MCFSVLSDDSHSRVRRAAASEKPHHDDYGKQHSYDAAKMIYNSKNANHILHFASIAILAVFVVEVGVMLLRTGVMLMGE